MKVFLDLKNFMMISFLGILNAEVRTGATVAMKKQVKFGSKQGKPYLSNALLSFFKCNRF